MTLEPTNFIQYNGLRGTDVNVAEGQFSSWDDSVNKHTLELAQRFVSFFSRDPLCRIGPRRPPPTPMNLFVI